MKFTVVTYGTEGDTRPIAAVCAALAKRGHAVRLLADRSTLDAARACGIETDALAGDMKGTLGPGGALAQVLSERGDVGQFAKVVARIANEHTTEWLSQVVQDAQSSDAILFSGMASYVGLAAAEALRLPAIGLGLWPMSPTREFPSALLPPMRMPGFLNLLSHRLVNAVAWRLFRKGVNEARRTVCGQAPRRSMWRDYPILYGYSRHLLPRPADWDARWQVCGHWSLPQGPWDPPDRLSQFLAEGEPPIYVGFGSMGGFNRRRLVDSFVEAVAGRRALFYAGWSGIDPSELPPNFLAIDATPHTWLFPRVSLVIHHGGAGTTHAAAGAGVPSVVVPFAGDQFFWADRLAAAGVAPRSVRHDRLDGAALRQLIDFASDPAVAQRARVLGQRIAGEHGTGNAAEQIERFAARET